MASKLVTDRQKGAEAVAAIAEAQGSTLAQSLATVIPEGGQTAAALVQQLQRALVNARDTMVQADAAHERELADDPSARNQRDASASDLASKLAEVRAVLTGLYGMSVAQRILPQVTPRDPVVLARFAAEVVGALQRVSLPKARVAGAQFDAGEAARDLSQTQTALKSQLEAVAREVREAQDTLVKKNRAIEDYDRVFHGVATVLTGLFSLAGQQELANKVRPSVRRPGTTFEQEESDEAPTSSTTPT